MIEPLRLAFGPENEEDNMLAADVPVLGVGGEHELPVPDEGVCSRAVYQRFSSQYRRWVQKKADDEPCDVSRQRAFDRLMMKNKTPKQKAELARKFWAEDSCPTSEEDKAMILAHFKKKEEGQKAAARKRWFRGNAGLWTYNGDWGVMDEVTLPMTRTASVQDEIEEVVLQCQHSKKLRELWEDFQKFWFKKVKFFNFTHFALAFELCTHTLADSRAVRVHAHACCRAGHPVHIEKSELLSWQGTEPHMSQPFGICRQRAAGSNACFFYLQCPKIGVVYQDANIKPFVDYLVSGEWVFNLLQQNKIKLADAREQLVRSAKNLQRLLPNLDALDKCRRESQLQARIDMVRSALLAETKPFHRIEAIEKWKEDHRAIKMRYKFLVLVGPSGLGKTQYAKSLVPEGRSLELNMAAAPEPDLKDYDPELHDLILFDECPAQIILRQKKVFQAPAVKVALAASVTGCYAYSVWLHQKMLVVCSNVWHHELRLLPAEDRDWLLSNSVVYTADKPLWNEDVPSCGDPVGSVECSMADSP